jgi:hypothetical protein
MRRGSAMWTTRRQQASRVLAACCAMLWLAGPLWVAQGNLTTQWTGTHCPQGQTQNGQHSHNHCAWHCVGLDIQGGSVRGEVPADVHRSFVWSLGAIPLRDAALDGEFPPRGPPQGLLPIA